MLNEDYVTFEQAKLLKEKGFPQLGYKFKLYYEHTKSIEHCNGIPDCEINKLLLWYCPTLSLVQKWLREEKNIHINSIWVKENNKYYFQYEEQIECHIASDNKLYPIEYNTYEEALSAGINKALELI